MEKAELGRSGADAVEMEAAAVAARAQEYHIPFYAVRVVTDTSEESFPLDFNSMRSSDGRFSRAQILAAALRRPATIFPELHKLNKTTKRAAQALGTFLPTLDSELVAAPVAMRAAVYTGDSMVSVEQVPTPAIGPGELLIRVESCGICHTDLKKIEYNLLAPPRIFGHETAGVVAAIGAGVRGFSAGDRVIVFHHIPCGECFYCRHKLYAQCPVYKKVGVTAGYEPAGGGFSQYVRVMDWIVRRGVEKIPEGVSFDRACFVEPVNTCVKGVVQLDPHAEDVVVILGQGPIGLLFTDAGEALRSHHGGYRHHAVSAGISPALWRSGRA